MMNQIATFAQDEDLGLPVGTRLLSGQYNILHLLQKGGFAITYLARDSLERLVVIKECFPFGMCERIDGKVRALSPGLVPQFEALKRQFVREARTLAALRHPGIVAVHQVFEENDSAYMALDFVAGIDLITLLEDQPERLTPAFLESSLRQTLDALRFIHDQGVLHRDIAPDNIRVDDDGRITLIDFGAASRQAVTSDQAQASMLAVKDGYSPSEFYQRDGVHDASSDLYSLAATFYHLITGAAPPNCCDRAEAIGTGAPDPCQALANGDWAYGLNMLDLLDSALAIDRRNRPPNADAWQQALNAPPRARTVPIIGPAMSEVDLVAVISRLVHDTNVAMAAQPLQGKRALQRPKVRAEAAGPQRRVRKHWVDIVGAPITDIEAWLREQERPKPAPAKIEEELVEPEPALDPVIGPAPEPKPEPVSTPRRSGFGMKSLFAGLGLQSLYRDDARSAT